MSKLTQLLASKIVLQRDLAPKSESAHGARAAFCGADTDAMKRSYDKCPN